jgi:hypothetical protein
MAAMLEEDEHVTFHPRDKEEEEEEEQDAKTVDKEILMMEEDGKSIITRSRAKKRVALVYRRPTTQSSRVSFGDSVASPITVDGTLTQRSVMTEAEVESIVQNKVIPTITLEFQQQFGIMQTNLQDEMTVMFERMQQNLTATTNPHAQQFHCCSHCMVHHIVPHNSLER